MTRRPTNGPVPWLDWRFSLLLPIGLVLLLGTGLLLALNPEPERLDIVVTSGVTAAPIEDASVAVGATRYRTNDLGEVRVERPQDGTSVEVSADGFRTQTGEVQDTGGSRQTVTLQPAVLQGTITREDTGEPIGGITVAILDASGAELQRTTTDGDGIYRFRDVPETGQVQVRSPEWGVAEQELTAAPEASFTMQRQVATGRVLDETGEALQGAVLRSGDATAVAAGDGTFELVGVTAGADVTVAASGFEDLRLTVGEGGRVDDVQMSRQLIRGLYANYSILGSPGGLDSLIEIANTTEINAIVIDIKQDTVYYDSQVRFFRDAGSVNPIYDVEEVLAKLEENDIYAIARLVVFQDPLVAEARPDLAVLDSGGGLWRNELGIGWVNAFNEELWDANIELAVEALGHGFDEIQYDYVRFPSDGDLSTAEFGQEYTAEAREAAITSFMARSHEAIRARDGRLGADLFGFVTLVDDEQYIGQRFSALEPHLDFVCMMIYPSHFIEGNIASAPGHPNDYPYETIFESLERAETLVPGSARKFRPWLQDFNYGGLRPYEADDVRAQIDAAEDFGASGWMLWGDPFNVTVEALEPQTAVIAPPGTARLRRRHRRP